MSQLRVAVVGAGPKGRQHVNVLHDFEDVDLVALCDPVDEVRDSVGDAFHVPNRYADLDAMLDVETLDAVFLGTPPQLNAPIAQICVERGLHTFLEKPPGMNTEETEALRDAVDRTGVKAMVGLNRRFHPIINRALEMVRERGPVVQLVGEFHKSLEGIITRNKYPFPVLDNFLMTNDIHAIDIVRFMAGAEVKQVHSFARRVNSPYRNVHAALVRFDNDIIASYTFNYTTGDRLERYEIHGIGVSAYLEGVKRGTVFCSGERHDLTEAEWGASGGTVEEDRFFLDCIQKDRPVTLPGASMDEAVKTAKLVDAIREGIIEP
ncbi:MAG: Gfo/Idh/MocA family oxidoreductase [Gemmatimonadota bacterium]|nr:Gfo/Idh/MocA family oxidoreductase [Gemmatimonadota bacterium]